MTFRIGLLLGDVFRGALKIVSAILQWIIENHGVLCLIFILTSVAFGAVVGVSFTPGFINDSSYIFFRHYWYISTILAAVGILLGLPYGAIGNLFYRGYIRYCLPVSQAPKYLAHPDKKVQELAKAIVSGNLDPKVCNEK